MIELTKRRIPKVFVATVEVHEGSIVFTVRKQPRDIKRDARYHVWTDPATEIEFRKCSCVEVRPHDTEELGTGAPIRGAVFIKGVNAIESERHYISARDIPPEFIGRLGLACENFNEWLVEEGYS